jgi:nucleoside-diphosphate-sugar epimerase
MKVLVTGGFGNVGRSVVASCIAWGDEVSVFDSPKALAKGAKGLKNLIRGRWGSSRLFLGDIRDEAAILKALEVARWPEAVIHLAALIPPAADVDEKKTWDINVGGTKALIEACSKAAKKPKIVLASSIATYGDRLSNFWIGTEDPPAPTETYGASKVACETMLKDSGLDFSILRLSYVVWAKWFPFDPLLFSMPPETRIEIIHTEDAGRAFASAARKDEAKGRVFNIGGGQACRTNFRSYLDRIFLNFGLGRSGFLPNEAFATGGFHCGWYKDSDQAETVLQFRSKTLADFYEEVRWEKRFLRPLIRAASPFAKAWLRAKSPYAPQPR